MRFELGDTLTDGGAETCALADEEYEGVLADLAPGRKAWLHAKLCALEAVFIKLQYQVDTKIDVLQYGFGERAERWRKIYDDLRKEISATGGLPTMDRGAMKKPPYFYTGMQGNPYAE
jgi:hypothetical protein